MTASKIPAAIDALIEIFSNAIGSEYVHDGPGPTPPNGNCYVFVGCANSDDENSESASSDQGWAWLGHTMRDENIEVYCDVRAWTGDQNDQRSARQLAFDTLGALTDAITTDPSLDNSVIQVTGIRSGTLRQFQNSSGANASLAFTVTCVARVA
jgi:hypothetical protein